MLEPLKTQLALNLCLKPLFNISFLQLTPYDDFYGHPLNNKSPQINTSNTFTKKFETSFIIKKSYFHIFFYALLIGNDRLGNKVEYLGMYKEGIIKILKNNVFRRLLKLLDSGNNFRAIKE